ncbi:MAG: Plug domain-containing protein [Bacteroidales bacterium]|nr:Plug domain-containing protein [Bacteroidales bacterium]
MSELKVLPGSSVADALRIFRRYSEGLWRTRRVEDRGGEKPGANHRGFVDGVPLSDAATGQVDLGKIPLENLESIELYIGQEQQLCRLRARASRYPGISYGYA